MIRSWIWALIFAVAPPICQGQGIQEQVNLRSMSVGGLHLYGVSASTGYSTSAYPQSGELGAVGTPLLGGDVNYGAGFSAGWVRARAKTNISFSYSGSYSGNVRYSELSSYNQSVSFNIGRTLRSRWSVSLSVAGSDATAMQFLYQPTSLSVMTQLPATLDDLAAAFSIGQFSNSQAAAMLTGATLLDSPLRSVLLGTRVLSYSALGGVSYARSSRLHFHFGSASAFGQSWRGKNLRPQPGASPRNLGVNGGLGMSYQLSPRTTMEFSVEENQTSNSYQKGFTTSSNVSIGRKMSPHWFAAVSGGAAFTYLTQQSMGNARTSNVIGSGSLGYQASVYTILGFYQRSSSDSYGLAAGTITNLSLAGTWHPRGSRWTLVSSVRQQQIRNTGFASLNGYQVSAGLSCGLNHQTTMTAQYVYSFNRGNYVNLPIDYDVHSVRLSFGWSPQQMKR